MNMDNIYAQRVARLRLMMDERGWDAMVITGSDPHSSEYPAERWKQVEWISGFTGEAGDMVITQDHAGLWTDTRYFIQAERQLAGTGIELHKTRIPEQVLIPDWLAGKFTGQREMVVAVDGICMSTCTIREITGALAEAGTECLVASVPDLLDSLWTDRPAIPQTTIITVDPGESRRSKIEWLRSFINSQGCAGMLLSSLDEIAWILNVRGSDIEYNPMVISYLLITEDKVRWYVTKGLTDDPHTARSFARLEDDGVQILAYSDAELALSTFGAPLAVDPDTLNYHMFQAIGGNAVQVQSPVPLRKAVKNPTEIEGMKRAHLLDGLAMERFLYWLEKSVEAQRCISEWDASVKLGQFRAEIEGYMGDSFETISAYGPGAALPHYVTPSTDAPTLYSEGLYLNDSGGQYEFGTTDITRTVPLGHCSQLEREDYTLVLKCHIDLAMAIWPAGTPGCRLDALAREPLWRAKRNFGHGTGHGVGYFLGVHEGPHDMRQNLNAVPLVPGMMITDEPGIYREGKHGIRHENMLMVVEAGTNDFGSWLQFETLTLCHFDTGAIIKELLTKEETQWLNDYNQRVWRTYKDKLPRPVAEWLKEKTAAI